MRFSHHLALAVAAASSVSAYQQAVYYDDYENVRPLADYCASGQGIDIIVLAFLGNFGGGAYPNGEIGGCQINPDGSTSNCQSLIDGINSCHANGKKVVISLGGGGSPYQITSKGDATGIAYSLWNSYARPQATSNSPRPFGNAYVDGWDFDIESDNGSQAYLGDLINALRGYFSKDSGHQYIITGAPQCPLPEGNMGNSMMQAQYDYLFIQFYNNNCAAAELVRPGGETNPQIGNAKYNFADWPGYLSNGASKNAKLFVGLPASEAAADNYDYIRTKELPQVLSNSEGVKGFAGVMLFDAGNSDVVNVNGCNYAQEVRHVLDTGSTC